MKSYTDLEQSKKLTKILPLESADMCINSTNPYMIFTEVRPMEGFDDEHDPAWSLAALLELLPKRLEIMDNVYELSVYLYGLYYWNINNGNLCFESKDKDNLVDACVAMVEKLHKLKML